jgi:hypothetical protein
MAESELDDDVLTWRQEDGVMVEVEWRVGTSGSDQLRLQLFSGLSVLITPAQLIRIGRVREARYWTCPIGESELAARDGAR